MRFAYGENENIQIINQINGVQSYIPNPESSRSQNTVSLSPTESPSTVRLEIDRYSNLAMNSSFLTKAFVQGVMEGMVTLSQGGRGPTERGFAIDFLITVTPWTNAFFLTLFDQEPYIALP